MIFKQVRACIANQLEIAEDTIQLESKLIDDLKADSLDVVEMIMDLEMEFNMEIPDKDLEAIATVGDIVNYIQGHKA